MEDKLVKTTRLIQLVVLFSMCSLIVWHSVRWQSTGMYLDMYRWLGTDRAYLTVLYNLGLMLSLGLLLGLLMERIFDFKRSKK